MKNLLQRQHRLALLIIATFILPLCLSSNAAATNITGGFEIRIDQNLIVLDGKANIKNLEAAIADGATGLQDSLDVALLDNLMLAAMWRPYTNVLMEREYPGLLLSNDLSSNANIVSMEISLANPSNQFMPFANGEYIVESFASGEYKLFDMNTYNFQQVDPDQVSNSASILDGGKRLALSFGNGGIRPGRATTFNVYSSAGMLLENFFDENTQVTVVYEDPLTGDVAPATTTLGANINTFNNDLVAQLMNGTNPGGIHFRDSVGSFLQTGAIPEPTSLLLLSSGLGIFALRRRRIAR
ncbi:MAG: PEP-CTERM sorting domain-containing protein [Planctomycetes bacterium]|nr:PEP-CTERM sorting domain-containing protein [Planctomycetota bacterium]